MPASTSGDANRALRARVPTFMVYPNQRKRAIIETVNDELKEYTDTRKSTNT